MKPPQGVQFLAPHLCVIGRFVPASFDPLAREYSREIMGEMFKILEALGIPLHPGCTGCTVRSPSVNGETHRMFYATNNKEWHDGWHRDYTGMGVSDVGVVMWASSDPTEFMFPDGRIVQPAPFDVVLALNSAMEHRVPPVIRSDRWFCRWLVEAPDWL